MIEKSQCEKQAIQIPRTEQVLRTKIRNLEMLVHSQQKCIEAYRDLVEVLQKGYSNES